MKIQLNMQPCMDVTFSCRHKQMKDGAEAMTREEKKKKDKNRENKRQKVGRGKDGKVIMRGRGQVLCTEEYPDSYQSSPDAYTVSQQKIHL